LNHLIMQQSICKLDAEQTPRTCHSVALSDTVA
jgi:hypothetical protein